METVAIPSDLTDQEHAKLLMPGFLHRRQQRVVDPVLAAKADRIAQIREDDQPISLADLEAARNRSLRNMVRRLHEMKPQEIMACVELLDAEIASRRTVHGENKEQTRKTREEMIQELQGEKPKEVQK